MRKGLGWFVIVLLVLLTCAGVWGWRMWLRVFAPVTAVEETRYLLIPTGADLEQVMDSITTNGLVRDVEAFRWTAERKNYPAKVRPGRYRIEPGESANALVDRLRSGEQDPVRLTFNSIKRTGELATKVSEKLECDREELLRMLEDDALAKRYGFTRETFIAMFIPDTYEFWWNTDADAFLDRMAKEYKRFWTPQRQAKARALDLSQSEVSTLASIVQAETGAMADAPVIAGVYLNRLRIGMPLQADPTLKFALGADSLNRVLDRDKAVDSPYNTYRHTGLPPGPINLPETRFLDAVLDPVKHDFLYFCARADLSGRSDFARTYEQHLVNARKYQRALNERGILR
jgi:UPF0755 protein